MEWAPFLYLRIRMIKSTTLLLLFSFPFMLYGQTPNFDNLVRKRYVPCNDVAQSAGEILNSFYTQKKEDSLMLFLDYWENKCEQNNAIFALKTCLSIKNNSFSDNLIDSNFFERLKTFERKRYYIRYPYTWRFDYTQNKLIDSLLNKIINDVPEYNISPDQKFLLFYFTSDNNTLKELEKPIHKKTKLAQLYINEMERVENQLEARFGVSFGAIIPNRSLATIGVMPSLHIFFGRRLRRHHWYGNLGIDFGKSKDTLEVLYKNNIVPTNDFLQLYVGAEYNYDFIQKKNVAMHWLGGIGYNQVSLLNSDNDFGEEAYIKRSLNLNTGLGIEYKKNNGVYGFQARYNIVNYKRQAGETNLAGNFLEIRLLVGFRAPHYSGRNR